MLFHLAGPGKVPVLMAVSVPKRLFKKAVDRNLLKRRIREAYRLNKQQLDGLVLPAGQTLHLLIQYQRKEILDFHRIESGLLEGFEKLRQEFHEKTLSANNSSAPQSH
jgi:ribonuclease P protein component